MARKQVRAAAGQRGAADPGLSASRVEHAKPSLSARASTPTASCRGPGGKLYAARATSSRAPRANVGFANLRRTRRSFAPPRQVPAVRRRAALHAWRHVGAYMRLIWWCTSFSVPSRSSRCCRCRSTCLGTRRRCGRAAGLPRVRHHVPHDRKRSGSIGSTLDLLISSRSCGARRQAGRVPRAVARNNELLDVESYTKIKGAPRSVSRILHHRRRQHLHRRLQAATRRDLGDRAARVLRAMGRGGAGGGVAREPRAHTSAREARRSRGAEGQPGGQLALARRPASPARPPSVAARPPARPLYCFGDAHPAAGRRSSAPFPSLAAPICRSAPRKSPTIARLWRGDCDDRRLEATVFEGGHRRHAVGCRAIVGHGRRRVHAGVGRGGVGGGGGVAGPSSLADDLGASSASDLQQTQAAMKLDKEMRKLQRDRKLNLGSSDRRSWTT